MSESYSEKMLDEIEGGDYKTGMGASAVIKKASDKVNAANKKTKKTKKKTVVVKPKEPWEQVNDMVGGITTWEDEYAKSKKK